MSDRKEIFNSCDVIDSVAMEILRDLVARARGVNYDGFVMYS